MAVRSYEPQLLWSNPKPLLIMEKEDGGGGGGTWSFNFLYILLGGKNTNFLSKVAQWQYSVLAWILCCTLTFTFPKDSELRSTSTAILLKYIESGFHLWNRQRNMSWMLSESLVLIRHFHTCTQIVNFTLVNSSLLSLFQQPNKRAF